MKLFQYALRNLWRNKLRSLITILGVLISIFVFCSVLTISDGVQTVIKNSSDDQVLVIFQKDRY